MTLTRQIGLVTALVLLTAIMAQCGDNDTLDGCSQRNQPQHYDQEKREWTCKPRQ